MSVSRKRLEVTAVLISPGFEQKKLSFEFKKKKKVKHLCIFEVEDQQKIIKKHR